MAHQLQNIHKGSHHIGYFLRYEDLDGIEDFCFQILLIFYQPVLGEELSLKKVL